MSSAPRGLAPREGLESVLMKMGRAGPPFEPRRRPQAGKSGDPHSQNADSLYFSPLGELIHGDVDVAVAPWHPRKRAQDVQPPDCEWP